MAWYSGWARITSSAIVSMPASGSPARYLRHVPKKVSRTWSRDGSNISGLGLLPVLAQVADDAFRASGLARRADVASVQDQPMVRVLLEFGLGEFHEPVLHGPRVLARRDARAVGDAEDVRVDRDGRLAEGGIQHHVRGLAADAGERFQ